MGFGENFSNLLGKGEKDEPKLANIDSQLGMLSMLRAGLDTGIKPEPQPTEDPIKTSNVIDPVLDQLITHFGPGPEKAQGEIGELLKKAGY